MAKKSPEDPPIDLPDDLVGSGILEASADGGEEGCVLPSSLSSSSSSSASRASFTSLSQVDADLALARTLQQQENAYMLLQMGNEAGEYYSVNGGVEYEYAEEDEVDQDLDVHQSRLPPEEGNYSIGEEGDEDDGEVDDDEGTVEGSLFVNDEAFAQALQEAEQRDATLYMMGLIGVNGSDREDDDDSYGSQDAWQDVDPDNMTYEELVALGEAVGTQSKGLMPDVIASLPCMKFVSASTDSEDPCVICRCDYEDGDTLSTLPCKHHYHSDCIKNWLQINKVCPMCSAEVLPSSSKES